MSYPEPRYFGENGEVTAVLRPADHPPELSGPGPEQSAHFLATGAGTGGEFGMYRWNMGADPTGPGPHYHRTMSESFFVLDGEVRLFDGQAWVDGRAGDFLYVPPGGIHGFRNDSGAPASMLILFTPGAPREAYFQGLADLAAGKRSMTEQEFQAFLDEHDNHYV